MIPPDSRINLLPPDAAEARALVAGLLGVVAPSGKPTRLQRDLFAAISHSMTGHDVDTAIIALTGPSQLADLMGDRNREFRTRIAQLAVLGELVLPAPPDDVCERVEQLIAVLGVGADLLFAGRANAAASLRFALTDFARNGYSGDWSADRFPLHTSAALVEAWEQSTDDAALAQQWAALGDCAPGTLGRAVYRFYRNRGFLFPGNPGSAPPLLAQHDWIHVLADYGAVIDNEIEVFAFIGRASPSPQSFSLLAMVISLFETGTLDRGAGTFFQADTGHLSQSGMTVRLADAFRRGALCGHDLMTVDWFTHADENLDAVRAQYSIVPKSPDAINAGSATPWEPGGITESQLVGGRMMAETDGIDYQPHSPN